MRVRDPLKASKPAAAKPINVLIVDDEPDVREALGTALELKTMRVHHASSLAEARLVLEKKKMDLALVDLTLPDGDGLSLADELSALRPAVQSIVITGRPSLDRAVDAIRVGALDFLSKPLDLNLLDECVGRALEKRDKDLEKTQRIKRLRKLCRKLHRARSDVSQQVDILCNDLVTAYQELAEQMKSVQAASRYKGQIEEELDLEELLRRTLEFVLDQTGPTNAAVFLPGIGGGYTVGGYVNYTFSRSEADVLLDHLASLTAGKIAEAEEPIHLTEEEDINLWLSDECEWLRGTHIIGIPVRNEEETLGSILLFRDADEPYDDESRQTVTNMGHAFADQLVKVIAIHHRGKHDDGESGGWEEDDSDGGLHVPF